MATVDFFFDLSCPYSFMVSTLINEICAPHNITAEWVPFLNSDQPTKAYTSASSKVKYNKKLLSFYAQRTVQNATFYHKLHQTPSTLHEMVYLASLSLQDRIKCAKKLFNSIWIGEMQNSIIQHVQQFQTHANYALSHKTLQENTRQAAQQFNIFTTPCIVVNKSQIFIGIDRLLQVQQMLSKTPLRHSPLPRMQYDRSGLVRADKLEFYFDFSSPWAFIGYCRLYELFGFVKEIVFKPILLGALFRDIGTPNAPAFAVSKSQRQYGSLDLERWRNSAGINLKFTTHFPIRTVLPLRVFIINNKTIDCIYRGAWQWNVNIGDANELCQLLDDYGFDGKQLIAQAKSDKAVKQILKDNTEHAKKHGMFGVPSYVVSNDYDRFIWGQDKLDIVKDLCCGWKPMLDVISVAKL
eukprot:25257_1